MRENLRLIARKQSTDPRIFCMVSKKRKKKKGKKQRKSNLAPLLVLKKKTKKFEEVGSLFSDVHVVFCCSRRLRTPTIVKSYN